ncbi:MAG: CehA/McbA family metallohydrolase [Myxococcales bacterium]
MRRLVAIAAICLACHRAPAQQAPDGGVVVDGGHALPGPGFAAAWRVNDPNELVSGPSTGGRKGDWEIANSRVKFVIEDARASDGFDPYGCSIAAADRQRDAGVPGESRWGEVWFGLDFRTADCTSIAVVNDGRDGEPAIIRATGHDAESPFMASLFAVTAQPAPLHATIYREYSLAPDSDTLLFTLTLQNDGDTTLDITAPYIGMAMNRGLRHWVDKSGFDFDFSDLARVNTSAQFYAAVGEKISYSVLELHAPFSPILNFAHVLIGQYPQLHIPAGQSDTFRFAIAVGTGDVASLQLAHAEVANVGDSLLSGAVADPAGNPVAGARVHVSDNTGVLSFARTSGDGSWSARVRPGTCLVRAVADDRPGSAVQTVAVPSTGLLGVNLQLGARSTIDATATDADLKPIPAKIVLEPVSTPRPSLPAAMGEMWDRQPIVVFSPDGKASVPVAPGTWHVTFSRGFEYDRPAFDVQAGSSVTAKLRRVIDTTGWISGDFHVHAQYSPDGDDLLALKVRAFAAEGVEVPVSTEHEFIGDFGPAAAAQGLTPFMHTIAGTELTTTATGHFNVFPLTPIAGALNAGGFDWYNKTIPDVMAEAKKRLTAAGEIPIVQMNHPRTAGMAYLDAIHFDPNNFVAGVDAPDFMKDGWDAMEIWNGVPLANFEGCLGDPNCVAPSHPTAFDWFSFLDRGRRVTGTGNSDSHNASLREVGYPRNYVQIGTDDPGAATDAQVTRALRAMKVTISGGPFLTIGAPGGGIGDVVQPDFSSGSPVVHLTVRVQAPAWMGALDHVDIWMGDTFPQGAHVVRTIGLTGAPVVDGLRYGAVVDIPISPAADTWLIATARGADVHALWPVVQEPVPPYAITNPIWIDADNDGTITPLR